jgi:hypothetical protein
MAGATICYDCDSKLRAIADLLSEAESSKPESAAAVPYWRQSLAEQVRPYWMRDSDEEDEDE